MHGAECRKKVTTLLEQWTTEEQHAVVRFFFFLTKRLSVKDVHKAKLPVCGGKSLLRQVIHKRVDKFSRRHTEVTGEDQPGCPVCVVTEATVRRLDEII